MRGRVNIVIGALIALAAIAAIAALLAMRVGAGEAPELRAIVHDGDGGVRELPLSQDSESTVTTSLGTNVVVVEGGSVFVRESDCDNHDCIRQGKVDAPGTQIICLPHKLWIEVVADGEDGSAMDADAVAGAEDVDVTSR